MNKRTAGQALARHTDDRIRITNRAVNLAILIAIVLAFTAQQTFAQQAATVQPCVDTSPKSTASTKAEDVTRTEVDSKIPEDAALKKLIEPFSGKVRALEIVIGKLDGDLKKEYIGSGSLGNFVSDGLRSEASKKLGRPIPVVITNSGGLRKSSVAAGDLRVRDIFELLPFENTLIQLDLTGEQLIKVLSIIVSERDVQSGARVTYRMNADKKPEFVSAKLIDPSSREVEIDPRATYTVVTIDYLMNLRSGSYTILQEGKNARPLGITIRDAMINYVKSETAAGRDIKSIEDKRYVQLDGSTAAPKTIQP